MTLLLNEDPKLNALIKKLPTVADGALGTSQKERDFAKEFHPFGRKALPLLLPLLTDGSDAVRKLVNEVLEGLPGKDDRELPRLIEAYRQGNTGVVFVISDIGSPKANRFLRDQIKKQPDTFGYTFEASARLGIRFIPSLLMLYRESEDKEIFETIEGLFQRLNMLHRVAPPKRVGGEAVEPLLAIALAKTSSVAKRRSTIRSLGTLGEVAQKVAPSLLVLSHQQPELASSINSALLAMKAPEAVEALRQQLRAKDQCDVYLLRSIAFMEANGRAVGSDITPLLASTDWELRWAAARVLGYIGYRGAIPSLISQLKNVEDWRVVWASAESLGRLQAPEAAPMLLKLSQQHWFAPVRETAKRALAPKPYLPPQSQWEFFSYADLGRSAIVTPSKPPADHLTAKLDIKRGKLIGTDHGEWGGTLELVLPDGSRQTLLKKNVHALAFLGGQIVAICGLAHLGLNNGEVYLIEEDQAGHWSAQLWRILPGAPIWARQKSSSLLEISCYSGQILLSEDGSLRSV
jgi:hypothetical protein